MSERNSSTIKFDKNSEIRRSRRIKLFFVFLLLILVLLGGIVGFLRKKDFQISDVAIIGTRSLDPQQVLSAAKRYLDGNYVIIIPKSNTLLLSKSDLSEYIIDQVPSITKATITFTEKNHIAINIEEKKPSYVWCNTDCYFVDTDGMIYEESPIFTSGIFTTFSGGTVEGDPIKKYFVSKDQFIKIKQVLMVLDQLSIHVLAINLGENITIHIDSIKDLTVGSMASIIITPEESIQNITDALTLLLNDKTFTSNVSTKGLMLQYIDIRFPDKIYYKFDTPVTEVQQTATQTSQTTTPNAKLLDKTQ